jgi:hypothetical protein
MNLKALVRGGWLIAGLGVLLLCGCATSALWSNRDYKGPATEPDLALYESAASGDLLAVYKEVSDRNGKMRRRAYYLNEFERAGTSRKPSFVRPKQSQGLPSVPVFLAESGEAVTNEGLYAVVATNQVEFTVWSNNRKLSSYSLPEYPDGWDRTKKVILTPFAVLADAVIVASVVGFVAGMIYLGNGSIPVN